GTRGAETAGKLLPERTTGCRGGPDSSARLVDFALTASGFAGQRASRFFSVRVLCGVLGDDPMRRLLVILALVTALTSLARAAFPPGFLWGTAISGFQTEMGGKPGHNDPSSDWWVWVHDADNRSQNREVFRALRRAHLKPFVTLNHFSLPLWIHDPIKARDAFNGTDPNGPPPSGFGPAGWVGAVTATEFAKYAAYLGWKFGDQVDL